MVAGNRVLQALVGRRTTSSYLPVPEISVLRALEAARWAPNHHLNEPWCFWWPVRLSPPVLETWRLKCLHAHLLGLCSLTETGHGTVRNRVRLNLQEPSKGSGSVVWFDA
jgi:hypothetical protein